MVKIAKRSNKLISKKCHRCILVQRNEKPWPERFWANVDKNGPVPENRPDLGPCWIWKAGKRSGYGRLWFGGRMQAAQRVSWELVNGPIKLLPDVDARGTCVCHHCDNRACVNPEHLFLGTHLDNMADRDSKKRAARGDNSGRRKHPENFPSGEQRNDSKLTNAKVREILALSLTGSCSQREIARRFKIDHSIVCRIIHGEDWKHVKRDFK
jgi:hypothetical protein